MWMTLGFEAVSDREKHSAVRFLYQSVHEDMDINQSAALSLSRPEPHTGHRIY
jgi:hypothetical protein